MNSHLSFRLIDPCIMKLTSHRAGIVADGTAARARELTGDEFSGEPGEARREETERGVFSSLCTGQ